MSLSKLYDLPILNHIPHRDYPTPYYQKTLQILKEYKITLKELNKGKVKQIYYRISYPNKRHSHQETFRWKIVNQNILPNYLKTFNYRTVRYAISCPLVLNQVNVHCVCNFRIQLFTCLPSAVSPDKFGLSLKKSLTISLKHLSHSITFTPLNFHVPIKFEFFTESIALILTVTNYCIWQIRKKQLNSDSPQLETVKPSNVLAMIFNHIKTREKKESSKTVKTNYEIIKNIRLEVGRKLHNLFR